MTARTALRAGALAVAIWLAAASPASAAIWVYLDGVANVNSWYRTGGLRGIAGGDVTFEDARVLVRIQTRQCTNPCPNGPWLIQEAWGGGSAGMNHTKRWDSLSQCRWEYSTTGALPMKCRYYS